MRDFDTKAAIIKLLDGTTIKGKVNLKSNTRLSDLINDPSTQFVVLFDISFREELGKVVIINKNQIVWLTPCDV
ncbi:MAG: hypothetical protein Q8P24_04575 [Desulfobacterales bacterium]|nr:hypothetical protein [Desulfobacterales bacterium]